jgi:putative ABC transport system permease protein
MMSFYPSLEVAWLQLSHGRTKLVAAAIGIIFADLLMWMQLGFLGAAVDSATSLYGKLRGDLVLVNPQTHDINGAEPFSRRLLERARAHVEVEAVAPLYTGTVRWKDPRSGQKRALFIYGIATHAPAIGTPGLLESAGRLNAADTCLFDLRARPELSGVTKAITAGSPLVAEINGRRIWVVGTTTIGASFAVDGNLVTNDANFHRLFPGRPPGSIDVGVVRLVAGADAQQVKVELQNLYGPDLLVLSAAEFADRAKDFMLRSRPINFIFGIGAFVGFLVGFAIVYQVLFTDVSNHLPQYATLKAIGYSDGSLRRIVLHEALILSVLGYIPGVALAWALYAFTVNATNLPMRITADRGLLIFGLTVVMCGLSGLLAMHKLRQADPADVF